MSCHDRLIASRGLAIILRMTLLRRFSGFLLTPLLLAAAFAQPTRPWSQGDPTADEQVAMEWLNAARMDPVATLTGLLNQAGSDSVIAAYLAGAEPATPAQFEQNLQSAFALAEANSVTFPNSSAISTAPLAFYPLFQQQAQSWGAQANLPGPIVPSQRPIPNYLYPPPASDVLLAGPENTLAGPDATGGTAAFGPLGSTYSEVAQANLYTPHHEPRIRSQPAVQPGFRLAPTRVPAARRPVAQSDRRPHPAGRHRYFTGIERRPDADSV